MFNPIRVICKVICTIWQSLYKALFMIYICVYIHIHNLVSEQKLYPYLIQCSVIVCRSWMYKIKKELSKFWNVYSNLKCANQVSFITSMQAENLETLAFWKDDIYNLDMNLGVSVNHEICQRNGIRSGWVGCITRISPYDVLRSWRISVVENR